MIQKLQKIFNSVTINSNGEITNQQQLDYLMSRLIERKLIIEQDLNLLKKYIKDFPINEENFHHYIMQIYKLGIENMIEKKEDEHLEILSNINKLFSNLNEEQLSNEDIVQILKSLAQNEKTLKAALANINKADFIIRSIRDDIQKFLWEKINEKIENISDIFLKNNDIEYNNPEDYQSKMQEKIKYEFEIIRVKKIRKMTKDGQIKEISKKAKMISNEIVYCADRNIPVLCYTIQNGYFDRKKIEYFYYYCEASSELLLSKYFINFLGYDEISSDQHKYYFFENVEHSLKLINLYKNIECEKPETNFFFKYIAKEILCAFRDLLYKCTYSFEFPITCDNFYYEKNNFRLYLKNIHFGPKRKSIMESQQIIEAKLLYFYGMILLNLLSINYANLNFLINNLNAACSNLEEFGKMQKVYDLINDIEAELTKTLDNDIVICIIVECLLTPYKAKLVFDEFYEKKKFLNKAINDRISKDVNENNDKNEDNIYNKNKIKSTKKDSNINNIETDTNDDKAAFLMPYKEGGINECKNESAIKKTLTINLLLIHPFYSKTQLNDEFLGYLFNENSNINNV